MAATPLYAPYISCPSIHFKSTDFATPKLGISATFTKLKQQNKVAFIPYITAGDPDLKTTAEALKLLDSCGSDVIELGIPHSHPVLDGPVIKASSTRSLAKGTTLDQVLNMLNEVAPQISSPILLFSYYNTILKHGVSNFTSKLKQTKAVRGLIVPDLPYEETSLLRTVAKRSGIEFVMITTPTTPRSRMRDIVEQSEGFVYLVSSAGGVTGMTQFSENLESVIEEIKREEREKAVVVGFGIGTPGHVREMVGLGADGVVVGSAIVKMLGEAECREDGLNKVEVLARSLKAELR